MHPDEYASYELGDFPDEDQDFALYTLGEDETMVDLGGGMIVPLSELLDDQDEGVEDDDESFDAGDELEDGEEVPVEPEVAAALYEAACWRAEQAGF